MAKTYGKKSFNDLSKDDLETAFRDRLISDGNLEGNQTLNKFNKGQELREERKKAQEEAAAEKKARKDRIADGTASIKDKFIEKSNYAKEFDKVHGGINKKWINDQQSANFARMQANAAETFERAAELKAEMGKV